MLSYTGVFPCKVFVNFSHSLQATETQHLSYEETNRLGRIKDLSN